MEKFTETYYSDLKIICSYCAIISFAIGTAILLLYIGTKSDKFVGLGLYFTVIAFIMNMLLFIFNMLFALLSKKYWKNYLINSGILLINAPIALLYFYLVVEIIGF